jgi:hypothetical protein
MQNQGIVLKRNFPNFELFCFYCKILTTVFLCDKTKAAGENFTPVKGLEC